MYNALKIKWNEKPSLAANRLFPQFSYYLERGGKVALDYIEENADFVETVLDGLDEVQALKAAIAKRNTAHENQLYFVREARRLESNIKSVLRTKYAYVQGYCEQNSMPWDKLTPETLLPSTRRAVETGQWEIAEDDSEPINEDTPPYGTDSEGEENVELIDGKYIGIVTHSDGRITALGEDDGEKVPLAPGEYRSATHIYTVGDTGEVTVTEVEDTGADGEGADDGGTSDDKLSPEDELCATIVALHNEGLNKAEIWAEVKAAAEAIEWTRTAVWAYIDKLNE